MSDTKGARERAEARFKKEAMKAEQSSKAMADYQAEKQATRDKTARLRGERLAKEAADAATARPSAPEKRHKPTKR